MATNYRIIATIEIGELRGTLMQVKNFYSKNSVAYATCVAAGVLGASLTWSADDDTMDVPELRGAIAAIEHATTGETPVYYMRGVSMDTGEVFSAVTLDRRVCVFFVNLAMSRWELRIGGLVASCRDHKGRLLLGIDTIDGRPVADHGDGKVKSFTRLYL